MKMESIKSHLRPYSILQKRETTINHAFASALAPNDEYNDEVVSNALKFLGQNPEHDLTCVYCGKKAETWDHVYGLVKNMNFSGYGHVVGNLLPCCKQCNSEKGNKYWLDYLKGKYVSNKKRNNKILRIKAYLNKYLRSRINYNILKAKHASDIKKYEALKSKMFSLMKRADKLASSIRLKISKSS